MEWNRLSSIDSTFPLPPFSLIFLFSPPINLLLETFAADSLLPLPLQLTFLVSIRRCIYSLSQSIVSRSQSISVVLVVRSDYVGFSFFSLPWTRLDFVSDWKRRILHVLIHCSSRKQMKIFHWMIRISNCDKTYYHRYRTLYRVRYRSIL